MEMHTKKRFRDSEDRISKLPEHLRQEILSYLPVKEAAATTILSSSWKDLWLTLSSLRLDHRFFSSIMDSNPEISQSHHKLFLYVNENIFVKRAELIDLQQQPNDNQIVLKELKVNIPRLTLGSKDIIPKNAARLLDELFAVVVVEFEVSKLNLAFGYPLDYISWKDDNLCGADTTRMPISGYTLTCWKQSDNLTDLTLSGCTISYCIKTRWSALRCLRLNYVDLSQRSLDGLTDNCLSVESLTLNKCSGTFNTLNASYLKRLTTLEIFDWKHYFSKIHISAPHLEHFEFSVGYKQGRSCVIHDLALSKGLKCLKLSGLNAWITDEWLNHIIVGSLSELKELELRDCPSLGRVKISSKSLEKISMFITRLMDLNIDDAPSLLHMDYVHYIRSSPTPSLRLNNLSAQAKGTILLGANHITQRGNTVQALDYAKLIQFLGSFSVMRRLDISCFTKIVVPPHLRRRMNPPLAVKGLKLNYCVYTFKHHDEFSDIIDGLLWLSPRLETIIIKFDLKTSKKLEFEYEEDDDTQERCYNCETHPIRCWRHCLAKVTITNEGIMDSTINAKYDAQLEELLNSGTKPKKVIVVNVNCCA